MTTTMALIVGYTLGWLSVLIAYHVLRPVADKSLPEDESEPATPAKTPEQIEADRQFQMWKAQMDDMLRYDGKGGVKDGYQDGTQ
jgi:hypothetical protein